MSSGGYNVQDRLTFLVEVKKTGDIAFIDSLKSKIASALQGANAETQKFESTTTRSMQNVNTQIERTGVMYNSLGQQVTRGVSQSTRAITDFNSAIRTTVGPLDNVISQSKSFSTQLGSLNQSITTTAGKTETMNAVLNESAAAYRAAATGARTYQTTVSQTNSALNMSMNAVEGHTEATKRNNEAIIQNVKHVTAMGLQFLMLSNIQSDSTLVQENIAMQEEKVAEAHQRVIATLQQYGKQSTQYQQALAAEQKAQRGLAFEQREATAQMHNMMFIYGMIGAEILGTAVPALLKYQETLASVRKGVDAFKGGFSSLGTVFTSFVGGFRNVSTEAIDFTGNLGKVEKAALKADTAGFKLRQGLGNIVGILGGGAGTGLIAGLGVAAVALALYGTNAGGARDAVNNFGVSIGKVNPALKGIGDALVGVAGAMGLTGESADEVNHHFDESRNAFDQAGKGYHDMVEGMTHDSNLLVSTIGEVLDVFGKFGKTVTDLATGKGGTQVDMTLPYDKAFEKYKKDVNSKTPFGVQINDDVLKQMFEGQSAQQKQQAALDAFMKSNQRGAMDKLNFMNPDEATKRGMNAHPEDTQKYLEGLKQESALYADTKDKIDKLNNAYADYESHIGIATVKGALMQLGISKYNAEVAVASEELITNNKYLETYAADLGNLSSQQRLANQGSQEQTKTFLDMEAAIYKNQGALAVYSNFLNSTHGQFVLFTTGAQEAQKTLDDQQAAIYTTAGELDVYSKKLANGTLQSLNFKTGVMEQRKALMDMQIETFKTSGALAEMDNQLATGQLQAAAYAAGLNDQHKAINQMAVDAASARGQLAYLTASMTEGVAQANAYAKAYDETALSIKKQGVEIAAAKGELNAMIASLSSAEHVQNMYNQGVIETDKSLVSLIDSTNKSAGATDELVARVKDGTMLWATYNKTLNDLNATEAQNRLTTAQIVAEHTYLVQNLKDTTKNTEEAFNAFQKAANGAYTWYQSLTTSAAATVGMNEGLTELAGTLKMSIPSSMRATTEQFQQMIGLFQKAPQAILDFRNELADTFGSFIGDLAGKMKEGSKDFDKALKDFGKENKIKFNDQIKDIFKFDAGAVNIVDFSKQATAMLSGALGNPKITDEGAKKFGESLSKGLEFQFKKIPENMRPIIDPMVKDLQERWSNPPPNAMSGAGKNSWYAQIALDMLQIKMMANGAVPSLEEVSSTLAGTPLQKYAADITTLIEKGGNLNNLKFDAVTGQLLDFGNAADTVAQKFSQSVAEVQKSIDTYNKLTGGLFKNATPTNSITKMSADQNNDLTPAELQALGVKGKPVGGSEAVDTSAIDKAQQAITQLTTAMAALEPAMQTVMTNVQNIMGTVLGQMAVTATAVFTAIGASASVMATTAQVQFTALQNVFGTTLGQMINTATAGFKAIGDAAVGVAVGVTTNYNKARENAAGVLVGMLQDATNEFKGIGATALQFAVGVNENYKKAEGDAQGILSSMQQDAATSFQAIGDSASKVSEGVDREFGKAADDGKSLISALETSANKSFDNMVSHIGKVASAIDGIGSSASSAKTKVDGLASAVNSLHDKTVTITTHYVTTGSSNGAARGVMGMMNFAIGGEATGKGDQTIVTGESGAELVRLTDKYGQMKTQLVKDIKSFSLKKGESIDVVPLEGFYAKRFKKMFGNILNMATGGQYSTEDIPAAAGQGFGVSGGADPNTASGPIVVSSDGKVHYRDGRVYSLTDWNNKPDNSRTLVAEGDDYGLAELPKGTFLEEDYSISKDPKAKFGPQYSYYVNNTDWRSPNATAPSPYESSNNGNNNTGGGDNPSSGGGSSGGSGGSSAGGSGGGGSSGSPFDNVNSSNGGISTQTNTQNSNGGNNYNYQNSNGNINQSGSFGTYTDENGNTMPDPYNRNLTSGQWGKSYLGNGVWYDPLTGTYSNGVGGDDGTGGTGGGGNGGNTQSPQIVQTSDGRVKITQSNGQQSIIIDGKEMLPQQTLNTFNDSVNQFSDSVDQQQDGQNGSNGINGANGVSTGGQVVYGQNGANGPAGADGQQSGQSFTDSHGNNYNYRTQTNTTSNVSGGNPQFPSGFPFNDVPDPTTNSSSGVGGGGGSGSSGRIFNKNLGEPNLSGIANTTNQSLYNNTTQKNDPTGWFRYDLIPDPISKTVPTRSLLPTTFGNGGGSDGSGGGGGSGNGGMTWPIDIQKLLQQILSELRNTRVTHIKIGDKELIDVVQDHIMDGFSNFK